LPEHPRPIFQRETWLNLNGPWQFDFDAEGVGETEQWHAEGKHTWQRQIVVPFPWEAKLSGIGDTKYKGVGWYSRSVRVPASWQGKRVWLCFGAVDWKARVWVNGQFVGAHVGGYTPFQFDITRHAAPGTEARITVRAEDFTAPEQPTGKQTGWYTRTSGIWQTVYVEPRAATHLDHVRVVTRVDTGAAGTARIELTARLQGPAQGLRVEAQVGTETVQFAPPNAAGVATGRLELAKAHLWSPDDPYLYAVTYKVFAGDQEIDRVSSYLGVREISVRPAPGRDYTYICLNGKPIYLRGDLHQSFHPDGIYQYPSDALLRRDYEYAKEIGINFLRIHIKSEIPRALYWADKLGVLIMEDQPNFSRYTAVSRANWELVLRATVARDISHPSILSWCNFNETWGIGAGGYGRDRQLWVRDMYHLTKKLDPTRLVEDNSPCRYDHVVTDINSWHFYINDYARARDHIANVVKQTFPGSTFNYVDGFVQANAPLINSEYGGISAGSGDQDISWCFKYLTNELRKHDKICGYIYTEQSDIEWEHNGFLNYDRSEKVYGYDYWFPGFSLADLNRADFVVLDSHPCPQIEPGKTLNVPVRLSHWSDEKADGLTLHWDADLLDRWGARRRKIASGSRPVTWQPYQVVPAGTLSVPMPAAGPAVGVLRVWLADRDGRRRAANYINFQVRGEAPRVEVIDQRRVALRFAPEALSAWQWEAGHAPLSDPPRSKVFGRGAGSIEYQVALPKEIRDRKIATLELVVEASAKAGDEKLAWPARKKKGDYPQTNKKTQWPTDLSVSVAGQEVLAKTLPDDPADARGVLSHVSQFHPGSYGWLVRAKIDVADHGDLLRTVAKTGRVPIRFEVSSKADHRGGLALFGTAAGRYPLDPTLIITFAEDHQLPSDFRSAEPVAQDRLAAARSAVVPTD
jgi:hypothetical protein